VVEPSHPEVARGERQLEALHQAALAITADLTLESVLQRIVDLARDLAGATYAALGVADERGRLVQFLTSGITPEARAALGPIPRGHGLLGALIRERRVLRVPNIAKDPRSVGFPPHHPRMTNLLGVPLIFQERVVGDLYLTDKRGAPDFDDDDARLVAMLAAQAAVAIANARLYAAMQGQYREAEARRQQLRTILDSIPSPVVIADERGRRILTNGAGRALFGDLADDPGGDAFPYTEVVAFAHPDGTPYPRGELPLDVALRTGEAIHEHEIVAVRRDGGRRTLLVNAAPLPGERGGRAGAVAVFRDITAAKEADQLKDEFLSLVSHELRTPLTTVLGAARTLRRHRERLDAATRDGLLDDIGGEAERLGRLVGNMLDLSRIRAGRLRLETEPFRLGPVIRRVLDLVGPALAGRAVVVRLPGDLPPVEGDAARVEQVVRNLLENAAKYVPDGGRVEVGARADGPMVIATVADDGPGISPEHLERIFERFHRVEASARRAPGAGLGLYLARHLIEAHGGRLWVASAPGRGSAFSFSLPIAQESAED
jgi:signal transduction histidine kinase